VHSRDYGEEPYCCDFVFVSETLARRVRSVEVESDTQASDHQPMLLEIDDR
jgi:endonuclease/exonuclease/phosphatase family metal-dependent hydrolase